MQKGRHEVFCTGKGSYNSIQVYLQTVEDDPDPAPL